MSTGDLQSILTLVAFVTFIGILAWAWSGRRREAFSEAARIPLDDDAPFRAPRGAPEQVDSASGEAR
jgi:cytochrome c oxidase cbb3-type subunit 4